MRSIFLILTLLVFPPLLLGNDKDRIEREWQKSFSVYLDHAESYIDAIAKDPGISFSYETLSSFIADRALNADKALKGDEDVALDELTFHLNERDQQTSQTIWNRSSQAKDRYAQMVREKTTTLLDKKKNASLDQRIETMLTVSRDFAQAIQMQLAMTSKL